MRICAGLWNLRWVAGLLPVVVVLCFKFSFLHDSIKVQGVVTKILHQDGKIGTSYPQVTFFDPGNKGATFTTNPVNIGIPGLPQLGEKVEVYFDPKDPSRSKLNSFIEMWLSTTILTILSLIYIIPAWWPFWFRRTHSMISDPSWMKKPWNEIEPKIITKIVLWKIVGFLALNIFILILYSFLGVTGPTHTTDWRFLSLVITCSLVAYSSFFPYFKIYEKGFIYCRNPLWPIYQFAWNEIKNVEYKTNKNQRNIFIISTENEKTTLVFKFTQFENLTIEQFFSLVREKTPSSVLDQSVLNWLAKK